MRSPAQARRRSPVAKKSGSPPRRRSPVLLGRRQTAVRVTALLNADRRGQLKRILLNLVKKFIAWFADGVPVDWAKFRGFFISINELLPNKSGTEKRESRKQRNRAQIHILSLCDHEDDHVAFEKYFSPTDASLCKFLYSHGLEGVEEYSDTLRAKKLATLSIKLILLMRVCVMSDVCV